MAKGEYKIKQCNVCSKEYRPTNHKQKTCAFVDDEHVKYRSRPVQLIICGHSDRKHYSLGLCRSCYEYSRYDPIKNSEQCKISYASNREVRKNSSREYATRNPFKVMLNSARRNAKRCGIEFNIDEGHLQSISSDYCPILGMRFERGVGKRNESSPSLDRISPTKGYVKGNVHIISWRANRIKNDSTPEELEIIAAYIRKIQS